MYLVTSDHRYFIALHKKRRGTFKTDVRYREVTFPQILKPTPWREHPNTLGISEIRGFDNPELNALIIFQVGNLSS